jgi:hypothetical protein
MTKFTAIFRPIESSPVGTNEKMDFINEVTALGSGDSDQLPAVTHNPITSYSSEFERRDQPDNRKVSLQTF